MTANTFLEEEQLLVCVCSPKLILTVAQELAKAELVTHHTSARPGAAK